MSVPERFGQAALPLAILPIATLLSYAVILMAAALHLDFEWLLAFGVLPLAAYYFLPNIGLVYLGLWGGAVYFKWRTSERDLRTKLIAIAYGTISGAAAAYTFWWYGTGQTFSYL